MVFIQKLFHQRIIRYAFVGGIGIPINLIALAVFLHIVGDAFYPLASGCAFEVSTTINFVLNQFFTYGDQQRPRGWNWVRRASKAQLTSLSALLVTFAIALVLKYELHFSPYAANALGIVCAFLYNFAISKRFVFRPAASTNSKSVHQVVEEQSTLFTSISPNTLLKDENNIQRRTDALPYEEMPRGVSETPGPFDFTSKAMLSIVVPVMNEQDNVRPLYEKLSTTLHSLRKHYEIIFIDDGSRDNTFAELQKLHYLYPEKVQVIRFRKNFGKTPALVAGFSRCRGDVVFTMDGDLQDDPEEIPNFLAKLDEGYDLVTSWKFPRLDPISKTFPSRIFNTLVSKLTGVYLHDINCGFKAYRREVLEDIHLKLYGEFHRFVPIIAHWRGFQIAEIKVHHHSRISGVSKFGGKRFARGLIDLMTIMFLTSSLHIPLRLFGKLGFWTFLTGFLVDAFVVMRSILVNDPIHNQPLLFVGILLMIFGFLLLLIGLLAEMIRYYSFQPDEEYSIKQELTRRDNGYTQNTFDSSMLEIQALFSDQPRVSSGSLHNGEQWRMQTAWNASGGAKPLHRSRVIPRRTTIIHN